MDDKDSGQGWWIPGISKGAIDTRRNILDRKTVVAALALLLLVVPKVGAQQEGRADVSALAQQAQNPLASLVSLPLLGNYNLGLGEDDRTFYNLNVQPVVPFSLSEDLNLITRTIVPINSVPVGQTESTFGIGDTSFSLFFSPASTGAITWGVGPSLTIPTASNPELLGSQKLSLGPTGVLFAALGKWTLGAVASNVWSVAGSADRDDVNLFFAQWFLNYNIGAGWAIGTAPVVTANWKAESGNQWTVPWGLQISKVTHFGSRPVSLMLGYYDNSTHPEGGPDSQVRFQLNFLFPQSPN